MRLSRLCLRIHLYFRVHSKMPRSIFQSLTDIEKPSFFSSAFKKIVAQILEVRSTIIYTFNFFFQLNNLAFVISEKFSDMHIATYCNYMINIGIFIKYTRGMTVFVQNLNYYLFQSVAALRSSSAMTCNMASISPYEILILFF